MEIREIIEIRGIIRQKSSGDQRDCEFGEIMRSEQYVTFSYYVSYDCENKTYYYYYILDQDIIRPESSDRSCD